MVFGTDGIRGLVDKEINAKLAYDIGRGFAMYIIKHKLGNKVVVGCDTRTSSDVYVSAVSCGLVDMGINVEIVGIVSTPMISFFVSRFNYSGGVMITASHNDHTYNGIKVFNQFGEKISSSGEQEIERNIFKQLNKIKCKGTITINNDLIDKYLTYLKENFPLDLSDKKIVLDCANGSNFHFAPTIYESLGANVIKISCNNDGNKINKNCGANHIERLVRFVKKYKADIGFAYDGDGDRLRVVLQNGIILSGDDILLIFSLYLQKKCELKNQSVVGTIMTNLGMEQTLSHHGITLYRSDVGDKNVIQLMSNQSLSIGGESSGHICFLNYIPNCDALYNSLFFMKCYNELIDFDTILSSSIKLPNVTKNIQVDKLFRSNFDKNIQLHKELDFIQKQYKSSRIIVRPSGTEPVIRIYVEGETMEENENIVKNIEKIIKK